MAKHKVVTTSDEIDRALEDAKKLDTEPRVLAVEYKAKPDLDLLILRLSDGRRHLIARENIEGLQTATPKQVAHVEILGQGTGLHWPDLDVDLYVPALLRNIYGNKRWMAELGRRGGVAKTQAKRKAARQNGLKGGRPKRARAIA